MKIKLSTSKAETHSGIRASLLGHRVGGPLSSAAQDALSELRRSSPEWVHHHLGTDYVAKSIPVASSPPAATEVEHATRELLARIPKDLRDHPAFTGFAHMTIQTDKKLEMGEG